MSNCTQEQRQLIEVLEKELEESLSFFVEENERKSSEIVKLRDKLRSYAKEIGENNKVLLQKINTSKQNALNISIEKENLEKQFHEREKEKNEKINQLEA